MGAPWFEVVGREMYAPPECRTTCGECHPVTLGRVTRDTTRGDVLARGAGSRSNSCAARTMLSLGRMLRCCSMLSIVVLALALPHRGSAGEPDGHASGVISVPAP